MTDYKYHPRIPTPVEAAIGGHRMKEFTAITVSSNVRLKDGSALPFLSGDWWEISVDLSTGQVENWPKGATAQYTVMRVGPDGIIEGWTSNETKPVETNGNND